LATETDVPVAIAAFAARRPICPAPTMRMSRPRSTPV
jgi:hypothetical protein